MVGRYVKKAALDRRVANLVGMKVRDVSGITAAFLEEVKKELIELNIVSFDGFGRMQLLEQAGAIAHLSVSGIKVRLGKRYRVTFRKAAPFTRMMRERRGGVESKEPMEKYGVDEEQKDNEKVAAEGCPLCGTKVERHGNVIACPVHGTEPFEKKG